MLRRTLTILSLFGLLLSVGLWGASYWHFLYVDGKFNIFLKSGWLGIHRGRTLEQHLDWATEVQALQQRKEYSFMRDFLQDGYIEKLQEMIAGDRKWSFFGFKDVHTTWWNHAFKPPIVSSKYLHLPMWMPAMVCTAIVGLNCAPPFLRRRKRKKLGLCMKCAYDLRASEDRCPECGTGFSN